MSHNKNQLTAAAFSASANNVAVTLTPPGLAGASGPSHIVVHSIYATVRSAGASVNTLKVAMVNTNLTLRLYAPVVAANPGLTFAEPHAAPFKFPVGAVTITFTTVTAADAATTSTDLQLIVNYSLE